MQTIPDVPRKTAWQRVILLAIAAFVFNTTEFVPVGLLTDIANSFSMQTADVGIMLTIYAWVVALMSLPLMLATRQVERRKLLILLFTLFILSHILSVIAWNFWILVIARTGIALAHAIFWSVTASMAIRVAPPGKKSQALSMLATGTSLALVLGVPLGRVIGQYFGWRATFTVIAIIAGILMLLLIKLFPKLNGENTGSLSSVPVLLKRPALVSIWLLLMLAVTAHYTAYSYIEPFMQTVASQGENFTTFLLLAFGAAGILGSVTFSLSGERFAPVLLPCAIGVMTLCVAMMYFLASHPWGITLLCVAWGVSMMIIALAIQIRVLSQASDATDVAMSFFSGIFNIGIGAGALLGSKVILQLSMSSLGYSSAIIGMFAFLWCVFIFYRYPVLRSNN